MLVRIIPELSREHCDVVKIFMHRVGNLVENLVVQNKTEQYIRVKYCMHKRKRERKRINFARIIKLKYLVLKTRVPLYHAERYNLRDYFRRNNCICYFKPVESREHIFRFGTLWCVRPELLLPVGQYRELKSSDNNRQFRSILSLYVLSQDIHGRCGEFPVTKTPSRSSVWAVEVRIDPFAEWPASCLHPSFFLFLSISISFTWGMIVYIGAKLCIPGEKRNISRETRLLRVFATSVPTGTENTIFTNAFPDAFADDEVRKRTRDFHFPLNFRVFELHLLDSSPSPLIFPFMFQKKEYK